MVIIGMLSYPPESEKEFMKRFLEQPPLPSYMTLRGPYGSSELGGMQAIAIYEFDQSKLAEALLFVAARYTKYHGVPGFTSSAKPWLEAPEGLKIMGISQKAKTKKPS